MTADLLFEKFISLCENKNIRVPEQKIFFFKKLLNIAKIDGLYLLRAGGGEAYCMMPELKLTWHPSSLDMSETYITTTIFF